MKKLIENSLLGKYEVESEKDILTIRIEKDSLLYVMGVLKNNKDLLFNQLTDICGIKCIRANFFSKISLFQIFIGIITK